MLCVDCPWVIAAARLSFPTGLLFYMSGKNRADVWIHLLLTLRWRTYEILKEESIFYPMAIKRWVQLTRSVPEGGSEINCLHFKLYMKLGSKCELESNGFTCVYMDVRAYVPEILWVFFLCLPLGGENICFTSTPSQIIEESISPISPKIRFYFLFGHVFEFCSEF